MTTRRSLTERFILFLKFSVIRLRHYYTTLTLYRGTHVEQQDSINNDQSSQRTYTTSLFTFVKR